MARHFRVISKPDSEGESWWYLESAPGQLSAIAPSNVKRDRFFYYLGFAIRKQGPPFPTPEAIELPELLADQLRDIRGLLVTIARAHRLIRTADHADTDEVLRLIAHALERLISSIGVLG